MDGTCVSMWKLSRSTEWMCVWIRKKLLGLLTLSRNSTESILFTGRSLFLFIFALSYQSVSVTKQIEICVKMQPLKRQTCLFKKVWMWSRAILSVCFFTSWSAVNLVFTETVDCLGSQKDFSLPSVHCCHCDLRIIWPAFLSSCDLDWFL